MVERPGAADATPLTGLLDDLQAAGRARTVSVGDVIDAFGNRPLGVLLTLFGLLALMPVIGDIPGASILFATLILLSIAQTWFGRGGLWAPDRLRRREIDRQRLERVIEWTRPWTLRLDRLFRPRLGMLSHGRANRIAISAVAALLAITFYALGFVPFGVNAPAAAVTCLGLGLIARDGLFVLIGYVLAGATVSVMIVVPT